MKKEKSGTSSSDNNLCVLQKPTIKHIVVSGNANLWLDTNQTGQVRS